VSFAIPTVTNVTGGPFNTAGGEPVTVTV
jgi:hypothetical protein